MQKTYWSNFCHKIGYAPRRYKRQSEADRESSPEYTPSSSRTKKKGSTVDYDKSYPQSYRKQGEKAGGKFVSVNEKYGNGHAYRMRSRESSEEPSSPSAEDTSDAYESNNVTRRRVNGASHPTPMITEHPTAKTSGQERTQTASPSLKTRSATQKERSANGDVDIPAPSDLQALDQLKEENRQLKARLDNKEETLEAVLRELEGERDKNKSLEMKVETVVLTSIKISPIIYWLYIPCTIFTCSFLH
uniref:Uncharacterized protein n=1 Tax=Opuntia streptacantha TaxID=393608 RepID=A0A7C9AWR3_OPUST